MLDLYNIDVLQRMKHVLDKEAVVCNSKEWDVLFEADGTNYRYDFNNGELLTL